MRNSSRERSGIGAAILTSVAWGGTFPIMGVLLNIFDPFWFNSVRYVGASAVLLVLLSFIEGKRAFRFDGRGWALAFMGAASIAGFNLFVLEGVRLAGPAHGGLIVAMSPLFSALLVWLRHKTKPNRITLAMMAVAVAGVACVVTKGHIASLTHGGSILGDALVAIGVFSISVYAVGSAEFSDWSALRFTTLSVTLGTLVTLAATAVAVAIGVSHLPAAALNAAAAAGMLYMSLIGGVFAYLAWNFAVARVGSQRAVLFMNLIPVVTFGIQLLLGQRFSPIELAGAAITLMALIVNNFATRQQPGAIVQSVSREAA